MNSNLTNQKKVFNKNKKKINLSKYLSKIISIKNIKLDSKNTINRKNNEYYSESKSEAQNKLLAKKELEIKSLKLKCEQLQEENNKYQLQKNINKKVPNENTSSNFPLKNEIKELWEKFAKIDILNNFIDFEEEPEIIYHIICELFLLSNKLIKEKSESKYKEILKIMGIKNNSIIMKDIESQFKNFIKEHLDEIFKDLENDNYFREYKIKIKNIFKEIIQNKLNNLKNKDEIFKIFCEILEQNDFNEMIKNINDLILIAQYNEPTLYYNIEENIKNRKLKILQILQIQNKKNYIIPNDNNKNSDYLLILNPPVLKEGIYFYENLKKIIMPYKGNYSKSSVIIEKEEELNNTNLYDKNNNYIIIKNINNKHNLTSCLSQKNNNKNLFNTNEDKKENKVKILKHKNNLLGLLTSRDSREKKIKNGKLEINKCSSNNKYEKYWRTLNDDNLNYFENFVIKKKNSKANKIISVSNEKVKRMQITNYIHNRGKRNNFGLNEFRNAGKYLASSYNSEDNVIIDKNKFNETNKIKEIKNGNKLINSLKIVNNKKNNSKKYIKKLSRSSKKSKIKIKSNQDSKRYSTNIANENDIITINKFIKKNKKGNLLIGEGNFNNTIDNNNNLTTNDIKYKIKNFNINYINFGNSGNIVGINNSNIYESKKKIGKDMNSFKNNFLYLPIDDIQKIIEANVKKQNAKFVKNLNNDLFNKISHKNLTNKDGVKEKLSWVKKENSLILCKRESGSNNIIRKKLRNLIEKNKTNIFPQSYVKSKQSKKKFEKYISLNELNNFKKVKSYTINNIEDYSLTNSVLNSAKKINNNKTSDILYKQKLYKKTRTNIGIGNDSSPFYIKLLKNKRKSIKNNSNIRKFTLIDIRNGKNKTSKENKLFKNSTNKVKYNKKNDYEKKKENNKSTSNILKNKLINKI